MVSARGVRTGITTRQIADLIAFKVRDLGLKPKTAMGYDKESRSRGVYLHSYVVVRARSRAAAGTVHLLSGAVKHLPQRRSS